LRDANFTRFIALVNSEITSAGPSRAFQIAGDSRCR
jgi:hypothetical protein